MPNSRGHSESDLVTGVGAGRAEWLSLKPILSKADDCGI